MPVLQQRGPNRAARTANRTQPVHRVAGEFPQCLAALTPTKARLGCRRVIQRVEVDVGHYDGAKRRRWDGEYAQQRDVQQQLQLAAHAVSCVRAAGAKLAPLDHCTAMMSINDACNLYIVCHAPPPHRVPFGFARARKAQRRRRGSRREATLVCVSRQARQVGKALWGFPPRTESVMFRCVCPDGTGVARRARAVCVEEATGGKLEIKPFSICVCGM